MPTTESEAGASRLAMLGAIAMGIAVAIVYPWVIESVLLRFGVRGTALFFLALLAASLPVRGRAPAGGGLAAGGFAALFAMAAATDDGAFLRLVPAWVYVGLAAWFAASLRDPESLVERGARWLVPEAPDFIGSYCRAVTAGWAAFFLGTAAVIAVLAFAGTPEHWRAFTSQNVWIAISVLMAIEFLFRKTFFRHYFHGGPFERLWSAIFPAERTERGRRSMAYIQRYREQQERESGEAARSE